MNTYFLNDSVSDSECMNICFYFNKSHLEPYLTLKCVITSYA